MTKQQFTQACSEQCTGVIQMAAKYAVTSDEIEDGNYCAFIFVQEMLEQDNDTPSGTKRALGPTLYEALQKFK